MQHKREFRRYCCGGMFAIALALSGAASAQDYAPCGEVVLPEIQVDRDPGANTPPYYVVLADGQTIRAFSLDDMRTILADLFFDATPAENPVCQSDNINSTLSLGQMGLTQSLGPGGTGNGLWALGVIDDIELDAGDGTTEYVAAGIDYNFGNQKAWHFGAGVAAVNAEQSTDKSTYTYGQYFRSKGGGPVAYLSYRRDLDQEGNSIRVNLSGSYLSTSTTNRVDYGSGSAVEEQTDGESLALNANAQWFHGFANSNNTVILMVGAGTTQNRFDSGLVTDRDDSFIYTGATYTHELTGRLRAFGNVTLQNAASDFAYGTNNDYRTTDYNVTGGGLLTKVSFGLAYDPNEMWSLLGTVSQATAENLKTTGLFVRVQRKFGN